MQLWSRYKGDLTTKVAMCYDIVMGKAWLEAPGQLGQALDRLSRAEPAPGPNGGLSPVRSLLTFDSAGWRTLMGV